MFCSVVDCFKSTEDGFVMKLLPKDNTLLNRWLTYVHLRPLILSQDNPICEYHFSKNKAIQSDGNTNESIIKKNKPFGNNLSRQKNDEETPLTSQDDECGSNDAIINSKNTDICRLCGTNNNISMKNIFTQEFTSSVEFHEFISSYLEIQIQVTDFLPKTICFGCARRINNIILYKEKCLKANAIMTELHAIKIQKEINSEDYIQLSEEEEEDYNVEYLDDNSDLYQYDDISLDELMTENINIIDLVTQDEKIIYDDTITNDDMILKDLNHDETLEKDSQQDDTSKKYKCSLCKKYFDSRVDKFHHYRLCKLEANENALKKPQYRCRETKPCPLCGRKVIDLRIHMQYHSDERKFCCDVCNNTFYTLTSLKSHMEIHKEKTLKCPECNKYFSGKDQLRRHRLRHNEAAKKHLCEFCSKRFLKPVELRVHIGVVHKGEKAFKCNECDEGFNYRHSLNRHAEKVHNKNIKVDRTNRISKYCCDL